MAIKASWGVIGFSGVIRPTHSLDIMRKTACFVINPIIVDGYASLFKCTTAVRASDKIGQPLRKTLTSGLRLDDMSLAWPAVVQLLVFIYSDTLSIFLRHPHY